MNAEAAPKRGRAARSKGGRGEREAAGALSIALGRLFRRAVGQCRRGADAPDVEPDGWTIGGESSAAWIEVKRGSATITAAMRQAAVACGSRLPVVLTRQDHGEWLVTVRLVDLPRFWAWLDAVLEPEPEPAPEHTSLLTGPDAPMRPSHLAVPQPLPRKFGGDS